MSKVTYKYLQGVKQIVYTEPTEQKKKHSKQLTSTTEQNTGKDQGQTYDVMDLLDTKVNTNTTTNEQNQSDIFYDMGFNDSMYTNNTESEEPTVTENFEDNLYNLDENKHKHYNTDEFIQYSIDFNNKVSAKEARTSIESRLPFIVDKADFKSFSDQRASKKNKKSAVIRETDGIYKPMVKMRKSGLTSEYKNTTPERIGFITVTQSPQLDRNFNTDLKPTRSKSKTKKLDKIVGILNEKFIISKKKGFNKRKIGYLPVSLSETQPLERFDNITEDEIITQQAKHSKSQNEQAYYDRLYSQKKLLENEQERGSNSSGSVQRYVEVIEDKGMGRFVVIAALLIVIWFIISTLLNSPLADNWSLDGLNIIKTEEQTNYEETNLELTMNATPTLRNNELNINLSSVEIEGITFTLEIIDNETEETVYESTELNSGTNIDVISIDNELYQNNTDENVYREVTVSCETFKEGKFIGEIEQNIEIKIKPQSE